MKYTSIRLTISQQIKMMPVLWMLFVLVSSCALIEAGQNDLNQKIMMGYQGWFLCQGDGSPANDWRHWFKNTTDPSAAQLNIDNWPDMTEYAQTYATRLLYGDGSTAKLYSAHDASTTMLHFEWMREYGIYGIYLQRFLGEAVNDARFFRIRNHVLENVIAAAAAYDRHFAMMYDITGVPEEEFYTKLVNDWQYLVDTFDLTNQPGYVRQNDVPVVAVWGMGFTHNEVTAATAQAVIDYFHHEAPPQYRAYVVGGVPSYWRTLEGDSRQELAWATVYRSFDMISPWTVGRYHNDGSADAWKANRIAPDIAECRAAGIDYMPVIFPGGSWFNLSGRIDSSRINDSPRNGGHFYWRQAYNVISAGAQFLYVAMFDEVDEGTAMFKLAPNDASAPTEGTLVTLDEDGYDLPSDWYLRIAGESQKMLDGSIALSSDMSLQPTRIAVRSVRVSPTAVTMAVGASRQLAVTVLPAKAFDKTVLWSTSDASVATVTEKGKIEAFAIGNATVTAESRDGGLRAECSVAVVSGAAVVSVTVSPTAATVEVGESLQLVAAIEPSDAFDQSVRWLSTAADVAAVDSTGCVSGVAEGEATITVRTLDGDKSARCRITVVDPKQMPYSGAPQPIPGRIEAEDYDHGGEGVAYHDLDATNNGGHYRSEGVDIETCSDGGYNVGWFNAGEWLEYTVDVAVAGRYDLEARVASQLNGVKFHLEFDGRNRTGVLNAPNTGGWQSWQTMTKKSILLTQGRQVMRIYREVDGADFNLDHVRFYPSTSSVTDRTTIPQENALHPAFPNPFNAQTVVLFALAEASPAKIVIVDILGRQVRALVDRPFAAGWHAVTWDGRDDRTVLLPSGLYFLRMEAASQFVEMRKIVLVR